MFSTLFLNILRNNIFGCSCIPWQNFVITVHEFFLSSLSLTCFSLSLRSDVTSSLNVEGIARQHDMLQKVLLFEGTSDMRGREGKQWMGKNEITT
jgi:hypothetical protein